MSDESVVPNRSHDQPAEGGRETVDEALGETPAPEPPGGGGRSRADEAGIVDQQDAALDAMTES